MQGEREVTSTVAINIKAVENLSDEQLAAQITLADTLFARVRLDDIRRYSLAYYDAERAVSVLTAERRRREEAAAIAAAEAILAEAAAHICPPSCQGALSHSSLCECRCRGEFHGADHRAGMTRAIDSYRARVNRAGGVFELMGPAPDDDEFAPVPADVRRARLAALDPEDYI
jgi:hypothetical protein